MATKKKNPNTKKKGNVESSTDTRTLACELSDKEFIDRSKKLAELNQRLRQKEEEKKATVSRFGAEIKSIKAELDEMSDVVANRSENRKVDVRIDFDYGKGEVREYRIDQDDDIEIHKRKMTTEERQAVLPGVDKKVSPPKDGDEDDEDNDSPSDDE